MSTQTNGPRRRTQAPGKGKNDIAVDDGIKESQVSEVRRPEYPAEATKTRDQAIAVGRNAIESVLLAIVSWCLVAGLIFGGCCSNVHITARLSTGESR